MEQRPDSRHQHDHAHQTVHHRRDARQQLYRRADHRRQLRRGHLRQKYSSQQSHRNADDDGPGSAVNRGQDKGQNSVLCAGGGVGGGPDPAQQKLKQADLPNGGQAGENEIDADEQHKGHRHDAAQQKNQMDDLLHGFAGTVAAPLRCMRGICNAFHRVDGGQNCVRVHVWLLSCFSREQPPPTAMDGGGLVMLREEGVCAGNPGRVPCTFLIARISAFAEIHACR